MENIENRYARVVAEVDAACQQAGRARDNVLLLAVSKFQPAAAIAALARLGQMDFGENYLQEAMAKRAELAEDPSCAPLRWHFTGHLQTNKAPRAVGAFALIHTLDSAKLADALQKAAAARGLRQAVLLEINIAAEPQKAGIMPAQAEKLVEHVLATCPALDLQGLMCLPPVFDSGDAARPFFAKLREIRDELQGKLGIKLPGLSMGMSGDFEGAIQEGATIVRIGTSIFGPRRGTISA